jgi:hypothetical protein
MNEQEQATLLRNGQLQVENSAHSRWEEPSRKSSWSQRSRDGCVQHDDKNAYPSPHSAHRAQCPSVLRAELCASLPQQWDGNYPLFQYSVSASINTACKPENFLQSASALATVAIHVLHLQETTINILSHQSITRSHHLPISAAGIQHLFILQPHHQYHVKEPRLHVRTVAKERLIQKPEIFVLHG